MIDLQKKVNMKLNNIIKLLQYQIIIIIISFK